MKATNLLVVIVLILSYSCKEQHKNDMNHEVIRIVSTEEFKKSIEDANVQLVDIRTPKEYSEGHIESAININFKSDNFLQKIKTLDKEQPIYLYCRSGNRSGKASKLLNENGFKQIIDLEGGIIDWKNKDFKTVK